MPLKIIHATTALHFKAAKQLFIDYQQFLEVDLCFQGFEKELTELDTMYAPPTGALLLAETGNSFVGCVAIRAISSSACEMKRLFVDEAFLKQGIGRKLVEEIIKEARKLHYETMVLDTLKKLQPAIRLYKSFGFIETAAYYNNPLNEVVYMVKQL
jgi:ribosomal protein S18 acetylase RimI-like enzyme